MTEKARKTTKTSLNDSAEAQDQSNNSAWCVYVLRCSNNSFYIGMTNNLEKRIDKHALGRGSKFVRSRRPFELVKSIPCKNSAEARRLEYELKRLTRKKKIEALALAADR